MHSKLSIVLMEPEIPQNTGNIGRTCVALGLCLHLVGKLGFSIDEKEVKRSGLDYWDKLDVRHHADWATFERSMPASARLYFLSTKGSISFWDVKLAAPAYLVFGNESRGLPPLFYEAHKEQLVRIPMVDGIRSLNLSSAVAASAYEAARQLHGLHDIEYH